MIQSNPLLMHAGGAYNTCVLFLFYAPQHSTTQQQATRLFLPNHFLGPSFRAMKNNRSLICRRPMHGKHSWSVNEWWTFEKKEDRVLRELFDSISPAFSQISMFLSHCLKIRTYKKSMVLHGPSLANVWTRVPEPHSVELSNSGPRNFYL